MISRAIGWINQWINERWPLSSVMRLTLDEEIPGGSRFIYTEGSAIFLLFTLQAVTGIMQIFFYVPTVDHAYDSLSYLRTEVPFGWLIHGIHYWGANLMIVAVSLHMTRVFIWGAYKKPRELVWLAGVLLLIITMGFSFTGSPLTWDQHGYWAGEVGTSIAGTVPVVGDLQKQLLRGGEGMGQLTLSRFFVLHTSVLPLMLLGMFGIHFIAFKFRGATGPWDARKRKVNGPFWPDQAFKDVITGTGIFVLLIFLSVFVRPVFWGPVDILDTSYVPKPDWNFLFLYQSLKYFQGPLEPVGTVGVPQVIVTLLVLLPFIDRNPEKNPFRRPFVMLCGLIFAATITTLTFLGYYSRGFAEMPGASSATPVKQSAAGNLQQAQSGADLKVFQSAGCTACHAVEGTGGTAGPALSRASLSGKGREWTVQQIRNPRSHNPNTIMPAFTSLSGQQVDTIVSFLVGPGERQGSAAKTAATVQQSPQTENRKKPGEERSVPVQAESWVVAGEAAHVIGNSERGGTAFKNYCSSCHGIKGTAGIPNPGSDRGKVPRLTPIERELYSKDPKVFAQNIDRFIQHGSVPSGDRPSLSMPAFGDTHAITQQEIANIEAYVMSLNGVDRAQIINPGMEPRSFFILVAAVYVLILFIQGGLRVKRNII